MLDFGFSFGPVAVPFSLIAIPAGAGQLPVHSTDEEDEEDAAETGDEDEPITGEDAGTAATLPFFGRLETPDSLIAIGLAPWPP